MKTATLIREATAEERPIVVDVTLEAYAQYEAHSDPAFWRQYQMNIRETLLHGETTTRLIAELDSRIVASVLFCPPYERRVGEQIIKNEYPEMRLLATLNQYRGRGIGAELIDFCEEKARLLGFDTITLHTTVLMQTAKGMYERRGYVRYPQIDFEPVKGFTVWGYWKQFKKPA